MKIRKKLRQAIAIALDYEEYIAIFHNGRGILAQWPIPLGIFVYFKGVKGLNSYVYEWFYGKLRRRSLDKVKQLLAEAGYPGGGNFKTGKLILNCDVSTTGSPEDRTRFS
ncbi:ABC transporter substrate-binding protein [Candidatus Coxiella mudrowiae]|uniref:ABC transporter substrate-binding protein n=1 Tax=Candidatus Coxiella mudrowiae TaxID=2054173 RepID=UPI001FD60A7F|nr:ABC transporter substrate-binding protein [Candidatus Coxiella mudrowiae]